MTDPLTILRERVRVVLVSPRYGGNIGMAARAMKTMGLRRLVLVSPREHDSAEAMYRAVHAKDVLAGAQVTDTLSAAIAHCGLVVGTSSRDRRLPLPQLSPRDAAATMLSAARVGEVALLFGGETSGLSGDDLNRCNLQVSIPSDAQYGSLNLAMAVQVLAYELFLAAGSDRPDELMPGKAASAAAPAATAQEMEYLIAHIERTLTRVGFHDPQRPRLMLQRLRRLLARARLEASEAHLLRGALVALDRATCSAASVDAQTAPPNAASVLAGNQPGK